LFRSAEAVLNLACVNEAALFTAAEIDAVKLTSFVCDAGDDEGISFSAGDLGPIRGTTRLIPRSRFSVTAPLEGRALADDG
jgi:hypothetical protein